MKVVLRAIAFGVLGGIFLLPASSAVSAQTTNVPRWSVHEIALTASGTYRNPYADTGVTATFQGPGQIKKTVKGFWNGGNAFLVRFTPTAEGAWTYTTRSDDAGLNGKTGTFTCTAAQPGDHGFLRRDAKHRYHFVWDDGARHFMCGNTYYGLMQNALAGDTWKASIDGSLRRGMNKVRFRVPPADPDKETADLAHYRKLEEVVRYMASRGMVANFLVFGNGSFGTQEQDERYLRYVLARYAAYPNVVWDLVAVQPAHGRGRRATGRGGGRSPLVHPAGQ